MPQDYDHKFHIYIQGKGGPGSADGASSLVSLEVDNKYTDYKDLTMVPDFKVKRYPIEQEFISARIWDLPSSPSFSKLARSYYKGIANNAAIIFAFICVIDLTYVASIDNVSAKIADFRECSGAPDATVFIIGNKCDLPRKISDAELRQLAKDVGAAGSFICSAKTGENVNNAFQTIMETIYRLKVAPEQPSLPPHGTVSGPANLTTPAQNESPPAYSKELPEGHRLLERGPHNHPKGKGPAAGS